VLAFALKKVAMRELISTWLEHLMLCASGVLASPSARLLTLKARHEFRAVADPGAVLGDLLEVYRWGQTQAFPLPPKSARDWMLAADSKRMTAAQAAWSGSPPFVPGERTDVWMAAAYGEDCEELPAGFEAAAQRVLGPALDHLESGGARSRRRSAGA
jgi:exonuclease V gamma subunit